MTRAPVVPPVAVDDLEGAIRDLRDAGLRLSTPRRLVLEALFSVRRPIGAGELAESLHLDESSVYRNLELLEQRGLVRHVHLGHSPGLYALAGEADTEYLYCEHCGRVSSLAPELLDPIREQIRARFGHTARFTHFPIAGSCEACATAAAAAE